MAVSGMFRLLPGWLALIVVVCAAVAAAGLLYRFVEQPMLGALRDRSKRSRPAVLTG